MLVCVNNLKGNFEFFNFENKSWHSSTLSPNLPQHRTLFGLQLFEHAYNDKKLSLYIFSGDSNCYAANKMFCFDLTYLSAQINSEKIDITEMSSIEKQKSNFTSVVFENKFLYTFGGEFVDNCVDECINMKSCERFDSEKNVWLKIKPMIVGRIQAAAVIYNDGCIYVAGGKNKDCEFEKTVERYDPKTNQWCKVATMNTARSNFALAVYKNRLWAIGGFGHSGSLATVESYNPIIDKYWKNETPLNQRRWDHAAIDYNDELIVVGGQEENDKCQF